MGNSTDLVSADALKTVQAVLNGVLLPILLVCGVIGNAISMAVFARQGLLDRVNVCLFSLAISDCGFNIFHFASRINSLFGFFNFSLAEYWNARGLIFIGVYMGFLNTSNILTLVISLERCICVVSPLHAKSMFTARQMAMAEAAIFVICIVGSGIGSFKFIPVQYPDPVTNSTRYRTGTITALTPSLPVITNFASKNDYTQTNSRVENADVNETKKNKHSNAGLTRDINPHVSPRQR